jgi:hypothetical protein
VLAIMTGLIARQLLIPPIVGLADNGDFERLMGQVGVRYLTDDYRERYFRYINQTYAVGEPWWSSGVISSQLGTLKAALVANRVLRHDGMLDLRTVGAANLLLFLVGAGVVLRAARTLPVRLRLLLSALAILIFTDVGYVCYFNSFYSEPASLAYLLLFVGVSVHVILTPVPRPGLMVWYFVVAVLLVLAKAQNAPLGWLAAAWGVVLFRSWRGRRWRAATAGGVVTLVLFTTAAYYFATPRDLREATLYNTLFYGILRVSPSREADLRFFGLDPALAAYTNTTYYSPEVPRGDPRLRAMLSSRVTQSRVVWFYATHPTRLLAVLARGARLAGHIHPPGHGNFAADSGRPPRARSQDFARWSRFRSSWPSEPWFLLALFAAALGAGLAHLVRAGTRVHRELTGLFLLGILMAAGQYLVKFIGNGLLDTVKQLFLFNVLIDLCLIAGILWAVHTMVAFVGRRQTTGATRAEV